MKVGKYEIEEEIARGGNGVVYRALDPSLQRRVAIKVMLGEQDARQRKRFEREAVALAKLDHPHIVPVHAAGVDEGQPYLVLELIDGPSLEDRLLADGPFSPTEAARITQKVAEAVQFAHGLSIVHRDIKPSNVLMRGDTPLLTDFGLARELDAPKSGSVSVHGRFMGTPGFCPPEQAKGEIERLGPPADVYGLGALLYALLCGEPPVEAESLMELLVATVEQPPLPLAQRGIEVPPDLEAVCMRCLEKAPEDRYTSAWELSQDLGRILEGRAPGWRSSQTNPTLPRETPREPPLAPTPMSPAKLAAVSLVGLLLMGALGGGAALGLITWLEGDRVGTVGTSTSTPTPTPTPDVAAAPGGWDEAAFARLQREVRSLTPYAGETLSSMRALLRSAGERQDAVRELIVEYLCNRLLFEEAGAFLAQARTGGPLSPRLRIYDVLIRIETEKEEGASVRLAEDFPDQAVGRLGQALVAIEKKRLPEAATMAELARRGLSDLPFAWSVEIHALTLNEQLSEAEALTREALERFPNNSQVLGRGAFLALYRQKGRLAAERLERALKLFHEPPPPLFVVPAIQAYLKTGQIDRALRLAEHGVASENAPLRFLRGLALEAAGRVPESSRVFAHLYEDDPARFEACAKQLLNASARRSLRAQIQVLRSTIRSTPASLRFRIGGIDAAVRRRLELRAQRATSSGASARRLTRALVLSAGAAPWKHIRTHLEAARSADRRSAGVALEYVRLALGRDALEDARAAIGRARPLVDRGGELELDRLAAAVEIQAGRYPAATARLKRLAAKDPNGTDGRCAQAWLALLGRDPAVALEVLERSLREAPDDYALRALQAEALFFRDAKRSLRAIRKLHAEVGAVDARLMTNWILAGIQYLFDAFAKTGLPSRGMISGGLQLSQETIALKRISEGASARIRIAEQYLRFPSLNMLPATVPRWIEATLTEAEQLEPKRSGPPFLKGVLALRQGRGAETVLRYWRDSLRRDPGQPEPSAWTAEFRRVYPDRAEALAELWSR